MGGCLWRDIEGPQARRSGKFKYMAREPFDLMNNFSLVFTNGV